jgi:hypothetical protein
MKEAACHPSRYMLDQYLADVLQVEESETTAQHLSHCLKCQQRIKAMQTQDADFYALYPTLESLSSSNFGAAPADTTSSGGVSGLLAFFRCWGFAMVGAVAVAGLITVFSVYHLMHLPTSASMKERIKGGSVMEIAIRRQNRSFLYQEQPLHAGDVLAFRYTTQRRFLLLFSLESSGRMNVFVPASSRKSETISPGSQIKLQQGIELDAYSGPERLIALFTDMPLDIAQVRREVSTRFKALKTPQRYLVAIGQLPFAGDQLSWLLQREAKSK